MIHEDNVRIESELEVKAYLQSLKYALNNGAEIKLQIKRYVDTKRDEKYTNQYTITVTMGSTPAHIKPKTEPAYFALKS